MMMINVHNLLRRLLEMFLVCCVMLLSSTQLWAQSENQGQAETEPPQQQGYRMGSGDVLSIAVYGEQDLTFPEIRVGDSGNITYPFLGAVEAKGKTTSELEEYIRTWLIAGEFLIDPEVTVRIIQYRPFYIDGEVAAPGSYSFEPGLTLRKAVSIAGGFTERASRSKINILSSETDNAKPVQAESLEVAINPGDIITVEQRFF